MCNNLCLAELAYNQCIMLDWFIRALSHLLVPMFLCGMAGSAIVVAVTLAHDIHDFLDDSGDEQTSTSQSLH